jgi:hypothetical protein
MKQNRQQIVRTAEGLLREWPRRMAMIPSAKPLSAAWIPDVSPFTGQRSLPGEGPWWEWTADNRLRDRTCGRLLPDRFPYRNHAAWRAFEESPLQTQDLQALAQAYVATRDSRYALAVTDLLARAGEIIPNYPLTFEKDSASGRLTRYGVSALGTRYVARVSYGWVDTVNLLRWLEAYALVRKCPAVSPAKDRLIQTLAQDVLAHNVFPNLFYLLDKYHNSITTYYEALIRTACLWGQSFTVREPVSGQIYRGGDLAQLALHGSKGILIFEANAFDRNGMYWELSPTYTGYIFGYLHRTLKLLAGYSDPKGYRPGPAVKPFYQPIRKFDPAAALPELWRAVVAQARLAMNDGRLIPTNDTNYLNSVQSEWLDTWGALLRSQPLKEAARHAARLKPGAKYALPSLESGATLMSACGAVTLRGPSNRLNLHLDWHAIQDYHSHKDPLNLVMVADGYLTLTDLGYHLGHPLRHIVSDRAAAHNTVTVDREDPARHGRGILHAFIGEGEVQLVDASVPDAYPQCDLYRRSVVLMGDRYVVDIFRAQGGSSHDYALLSRADESRCSIRLSDPYPGTVARPDRSYEGFAGLDSSLRSAAAPYEAFHHPRFASSRTSYSVDWVQRDRPDLTTRIHRLPFHDTESILLAKVPQKDRRNKAALGVDQILIARRQGDEALQSAFVSVLETLSKSAKPLVRVSRLSLKSPDPWAVAVEIRHEEGTDIVIHGLNRGPHQLPHHKIVLDGTFAVVRQSSRTNGRRIVMLEGRLSLRKKTVAGAASRTARVVGIDSAKSEIMLSRPLADGDIHWVSIRGHNGQSERWRVASVGRNGRTLRLDPADSRLIVLKGMIDRVENAGYFATGVNFCAAPIVGTPIRIGPVGDFTCPRYAVSEFRQSGLAHRIGGSTIRLEPRTYYIGLDARAALGPDDTGKFFWSSGVEMGDYVSTEPVTRAVVRAGRVARISAPDQEYGEKEVS